MDFKIIVCLFVICSSTYCVFAKSYPTFRQWAQEHQKVYKSVDEALYREKVYHDNQQEVQKLNKKYKGKTEYRLNHFADLTSEEFKDTVLMPRRTAPKFPKDKYIKTETPSGLPDSFDWTTQGKVTSVKDQGSVGTCWAFSTVGNIEGQWAMQGKPLTNLSVEQVVDCDDTKDPKDEKADCGVFGGWPFLAYQYIQKVGGLEPWADYPYCVGVKTGSLGGCYPCPAVGYNKTLCGPPVPWCLKNESCEAKVNSKKFLPGLKVVGWKAISEDETEMASALMKYGPLSVALDASRLQFYHRGVYKPIGCSKTELDHAVLIVGFGSEKVIVKTHKYWKVKNSWGEKWGENGYFKIERGQGTCGINTQVTTAQLQTSS